MKHILRGLGVMLLLWCIVYAMGVTVTGTPRPWEWQEAWAMSLAMLIGVFIGAITAAASAGVLPD